MSPGLLLVIRALHIVAGALWAGALVTVALFVMPAILAAGPAGGAVMKQIVQVRKIPLYMMALAILTVLSGLGLFWSDAHGNENFTHSPFGRAISIGAALAIVGFLIGLIVNMPTAKRLGALAEKMQAGGPPDAATAAEMQRLQLKMLAVTRFVAGLIVLAVIAMASARYL